MSLDLTIAGGPILATRSRVNNESRLYGTFAASSMQDILARIVDGDPESYWHEDPEAAADDAEETIDVSFQLRTAKVSREVDVILLQNCNLKNFKLEYSNDDDIPVNFTIVPGFDYRVGTANNAETDLIKSFTAIEMNYLRLTMYRTFEREDIEQTVVKMLGGIYACLSEVQLVQGALTKYDVKGRDNVRTVMLGNGNRSDEVVRRSAVSHTHWGAQVGLDQVAKSERDSIHSAKRSGQPVTFIPYPYGLPRECYTALFKGPIAEKHSSNYTGLGYAMDFMLEEAGPL